MFVKSCKIIRESLYAIASRGTIAYELADVSAGTGFMVAPGVCVTAAHIIHQNGDLTKPPFTTIQAVRSSELGQPMLNAVLIAEDLNRDLALLKIAVTDSPIAHLSKSQFDTGTACGALGFPFLSVNISLDGALSINTTERFQGGYISSFGRDRYLRNLPLKVYEVDSFMYGGSSGCPGFSIDGIIFGMFVSTAKAGMDKDASKPVTLAYLIPSTDIIEFAIANGITGIIQV